jgi:plasmid stabilization system protein ParE
VSWRIIISTPARTHMRDLIVWWRTHRPGTVQLVPREIKRVLRTLAESPYIGPPYRFSEAPNIRRCRLRRTPYYVYYQVQADKGAINVAAVWSAQRGEGPPI